MLLLLLSMGIVVALWMVVILWWVLEEERWLVDDFGKRMRNLLLRTRMNEPSDRAWNCSDTMLPLVGSWNRTLWEVTSEPNCWIVNDLKVTENGRSVMAYDWWRIQSTISSIDNKDPIDTSKSNGKPRENSETIPYRFKPTNSCASSWLSRQYSSFKRGAILGIVFFFLRWNDFVRGRWNWHFWANPWHECEWRVHGIAKNTILAPWIEECGAIEDQIGLNFDPNGELLFCPTRVLPLHTMSQTLRNWSILEISNL